MVVTKTIPRFELLRNLYVGRGPLQQRPDMGSSYEILTEASQRLGVSFYRLSFLLGLSRPDVLYRWLEGERSPGAVSLIRLLRLMMWDDAGLAVSMMDRILWDDSLILWRDGSVTQDVHDPAQSIPQGADVWRLAESLSHSRAQRTKENRRTGVDDRGMTVSPKGWSRNIPVI